MILCIAFVVDVIRRVKEQKVRPFAGHESSHIGRVRRIANQELLAPENPQIAGPRHRHYRQRVLPHFAPGARHDIERCLDELKKWCERHRLNQPWVLEQVLETLTPWT